LDSPGTAFQALNPLMTVFKRVSPGLPRGSNLSRFPYIIWLWFRDHRSTLAATGD
jgi:hypothetical protein